MTYFCEVGGVTAVNADSTRVIHPNARCGNAGQAMACCVIADARKKGPPESWALKRPGRSDRDAKLPDPHAVLRCEIEFLTGLYVKGRVPRIKIPDGIGTVLLGSMAIGCDDHAECFGPHLATPRLAKRDKEPLVTRESVPGWCFLALISRSVGVVSGGEACDIGNVLAERSLPLTCNPGSGS